MDVMDITDKTRVPLFAVLAAIPIFVGFIFWMTSLHASVSNAEISNVLQDKKIERTMDYLIEIRERLIRIEEKLNH